VTVEDQLKTYGIAIDSRLDNLLTVESSFPSELISAMRYACLSSGKRLRPALCLAACEAVGGRTEDALDAACAIEMVHSFSLIHDDLPALDDDDLRRGRPTCHIEFGEAIAILAGDGLFSMAFETVSRPNGLLSDAIQLRCVRLLSGSTGLSGLVSGEAADILAEGKPTDLAALEAIHSRKTGALIRASCEIGAVIGTHDESQIEAMREYGEMVGVAFQIADDILDETSTKEHLGKTAGADQTRMKATYPRLMGIEASQAKANEHAQAAISKLKKLKGPVEFLENLARFTVSRTR
jgi:geranylgeranyl diphosphate synthase type II